MEALARVALLIVILIVLLGIVVGASDFLHPVDAYIKWQEWLSQQQAQADARALELELTRQDALSRFAFREALSAALAQAVAEVAGALAFGVGVLLGVLAAAAACAGVLGIVWLAAAVPAFAKQPPEPPQPPQPPAPQAAYFHRTPYPAPYDGVNGNGAHGNETHGNGVAPDVVFLAGHRNRSSGTSGGRAKWEQAVTRGRGTTRNYRKAADLEDDYRSHYGH